jgi:hypothetical protein
MTKLEELLKWMNDSEYAPTYGELNEKVIQLIKEEQQVKNCDLADVVGQSESLCQCDDSPTKHFIKNWCDDCKKHIV